MGLFQCLKIKSNMNMPILEKVNNLRLTQTRQIFIQGVGDGMVCEFVNHQWAPVICHCRDLLPLNQEPILQSPSS
jgi:hypothetical protein